MPSGPDSLTEPRRGGRLVSMQTVNVEDVPARAAQIESWLGSGENVELVRDGRSFARLVPMETPAATNGATRPVPRVDWAAQRKEIWGDRVFSDEEVRQNREDILEIERL